LSLVVERIDVPEFIFLREPVSIVATIQPNLARVIRFSNRLKTGRIAESTSDELRLPAHLDIVAAYIESKESTVIPQCIHKERYRSMIEAVAA